MREPRVYVGAVLAIAALALYVQGQPRVAGQTGLRTLLLPTSAPTAGPTPRPTENPIDFQISRYVVRYGGAPSDYRDMITGDCSVLAARLRTQDERMDALATGTPEWLLAFGYSRALTWRRSDLRC
jgi:hypothetical protein